MFSHGEETRCKRVTEEREVLNFISFSVGEQVRGSATWMMLGP